MCGIAGIVELDPSRQVDVGVIERMRASMTHRGPDDAGLFVEGNVGLGHRRLSIVDLSERGHQPMSTPDGHYWIVYSGEACNFRELRKPLVAAGAQFRSETDTEALLHLYQIHG